MAVTTMPSTSSLVKTLAVEFAKITFESSNHFAWNPPTQTVYFVPDQPATQLLHELGHAILQHQSYYRDIELLKMEADAWNEAKKLATKNGVLLPDDDIEDHLDTYRDWLHSRSTCPSCVANGLQIDSSHYRCIECQTVWRVNEARTCGLKRYVETENTP